MPRRAVDPAPPRTIPFAALWAARCSLLVLLALALGTALIVDRVGWTEGTAVLLPIAAAGVGLGAVLASTRLSGWMAVPLGLLLGVLLCCAVVGQFLPAPAALLAGITRAPAGMLRQVGGDAAAFVQRIGHLATTAASGGTSMDNAMFLLALASVSWVQGLLGAWGVMRRHDPVVAVSPAGAILVGHAIASGASTAIVGGSFALLVSGTLLLAASLHAEVLQQRWRRQAIDHPNGLLGEAVVIALVLTCALSLLARLGPRPAETPLTGAFQWYLGEPWYGTVARVDRLFAGLDGGRRRVTAHGESLTLVEGRAALPMEREVMRVHVGPAPAEAAAGAALAGPSTRGGVAVGDGARPDSLPDEWRYWRGLTYDTYTGRSWRNSDTFRLPSTASEGASTPASANASRAIFHFALAPAPGDLLYTPGEPLRLNVPYLVQARSRDLAQTDHSALRATRPGVRGQAYEVLVAAAAPSADDLRRASAGPPAWTTRYLQLPDLSQRVRDLAAASAQGARTPYDRAMAVEQLLRQIPVTREAPAVPADRDAVEHVLFEAHTGTAEQMATAMAVLLRTQGIPARLASGYLAGRYDPHGKAFVATEREAHAWPEVYLTGYGWTTFEPSGDRPPIGRREPSTTPADACTAAYAGGAGMTGAGGAVEDVAATGLLGRAGSLDVCDAIGRWGERLDVPAGPASGSAERGVPARGPGHPGAGTAAGVLLAALVVGGATASYHVGAAYLAGRRPPARRVQDTYARLLVWGARAGQRRRQSETPLEFARRLQAVHARCAGSSPPAGRGAIGRLRWRLARRYLAPPAGEAVAIADAYVRTLYGHRPPTEAEADRVRDRWARLRRQLPLVSLAR